MRIFGFQPQTFFAALAALLALLVALWLDLGNQGRVWNILWQVTGETEPASQILGGMQYAATWTRTQPQTHADVPVQNIPENPFGVNTFLQLESFPEKRERQVRLLAEAGFGWIRQEFPWEDIEIHGRGDFTDRRNVEAVGEISSWDKYDNIVDLTEAYDINMIVRLSNPPDWAHEGMTTTTEGPPADLQDYVNFAVAVAERYRGRIHHYQVWNEPNLYPEWGEQPIDPAGYAEMLCAVHDALKAVDPDIVILTAAIGPSIDLSGRNAYDLLYLQRLYDAGIHDCYDVLSAQGYGLFSGPTDRRMRPTTVNFARVEWLRDVMVANGEAEKPIWISEAGWNPLPSEEEVPGILARDTYGIATMEQAVDWIPMAYERALSEWEWLGVMSFWYFKRPDDSERLQPWFYFRLLDPDFTPTPLYHSFKDTIQGGEWQTWRDLPETSESWPQEVRAQIPTVLAGAWGLLLSVYLLMRGLLERLTG